MRQPNNQDNPIGDPDLADAVKAYAQYKKAKGDVEQEAKDRDLARQLRAENDRLEQRLRDKESELARVIREKDADADRRVREARALMGVPMALLAYIATDPGQRDALLQFQRYASAQGLSVGKLLALEAQGAEGRQALAQYTEALMKGLADAVRASPAGAGADGLQALLRRWGEGV
ncbi:MAG: hypothetical protein HY681_08120 [Chloroflexi bacterium]|nr:hypothetical protein [Chloroflexota bacterium]